MTHIHGAVIWTEAVIVNRFENQNELEIVLSDDTTRVMNRKNWEDSFNENTFEITKSKLFKLKLNSKIKFATWVGYSERKYFCDIEEM